MAQVGHAGGDEECVTEFGDDALEWREARFGSVGVG